MKKDLQEKVKLNWQRLGWVKKLFFFWHSTQCSQGIDGKKSVVVKERKNKKRKVREGIESERLKSMWKTPLNNHDPPDD